MAEIYLFFQAICWTNSRKQHQPNPTSELQALSSHAFNSPSPQIPDDLLLRFPDTLLKTTLGEILLQQSPALIAPLPSLADGLFRDPMFRPVISSGSFNQPSRPLEGSVAGVPVVDRLYCIVADQYGGSALLFVRRREACPDVGDEFVETAHRFLTFGFGS